MSILYDEHPLIVNPTLATIIGLNEAIVLQQVHYWIEIERKSQDTDVLAKHYHDGKWWIYNTFDQWQKQFPFWCIRTIKTIISNLERKGLLISGNYNKYGYDRTKWYTINYEVLESLEISHSANSAQSKVQNLHDGKGKCCTSNTIDYPQTSTIDFIECKMVQNNKDICTVNFSYDVVINQIKRICREEYENIDVNNIVKIILYYLRSYERNEHKHHPKMQNKYYQKIIDCILCNDYTYEDYEVMIDKHFKTDYGKKIDYRILHFFTDGILENRMYETCY